MKTTNKILIGAFVIGILIATYLVLKVSSFIQIEELLPSGYTISEEIELEEFDSIAVKRGVIVNLEYDEAESLTIVADAAFRKLLTVKVENKLLTIETAKNLPDSTKITANLTASNLEKISVFDDAQLRSKERYVGDRLMLIANSKALIDLNLEVIALTCKTKGGSEVNVSGKVQSILVNTQKSSRINAGNLAVENAKVEASGNGYIQFSVSESLDVKAIDGGLVEYRGDPQIKSMEVNEGGKLIKL